jgi:hypothetical protein
MDQVVFALEEIQTFFITNNNSTSSCGGGAPSFVQVAVPTESSNASSSSFSLDTVAALIQTEWTNQVEAWNKRRQASKKTVVKLETTSPSLSSPFPFPRSPYSLDNIDKKFGNAVMVPIAGLQTSFLSMIVPCDVIADTSADLMKDAHAVAMLCELISRTEGPLYSAVRGNG